MSSLDQVVQKEEVKLQMKSLSNLPNLLSNRYAHLYQINFLTIPIPWISSNLKKSIDTTFWSRLWVSLWLRFKKLSKDWWSWVKISSTCTLVSWTIRCLITGIEWPMQVWNLFRAGWLTSSREWNSSKNGFRKDPQWRTTSFLHFTSLRDSILPSNRFMLDKIWSPLTLLSSWQKCMIITMFPKNWTSESIFTDFS